MSIHAAGHSQNGLCQFVRLKVVETATKSDYGVAVQGDRYSSEATLKAADLESVDRRGAMIARAPTVASLRRRAGTCDRSWWHVTVDDSRRNCSRIRRYLGHHKIAERKKRLGCFRWRRR
jgi:hypothetical protein